MQNSSILFFWIIFSVILRATRNSLKKQAVAHLVGNLEID